jgi:uncharacterized membrane protein (UPF0127 family)
MFLSLGSFAKQTQSPAQGQVKFTTKIIKIANVNINAEIAEKENEHSQGLMFRQKLKEGRGMLFVFKDEQSRTFWMKNTFIPLSIGFFDSKKKLIDIQDMEPMKSEMDTDIKTYTSAGPAQFALEVPVGWFSRHKIKVGAQLEISK